jgi:hypothetical protein
MSNPTQPGRTILVALDHGEVVVEPDGGTSVLAGQPSPSVVSALAPWALPLRA